MTVNKNYTHRFTDDFTYMHTIFSMYCCVSMHILEHSETGAQINMN